MLLVASFVEVVLGTKYSVSLIVIALVQAAAAKRYSRCSATVVGRSGVTILSALSVGIVHTAVLLLSGILVLQPARHHRHHLRGRSARWRRQSARRKCIALYRKSGVLSRCMPTRKEHNGENA